MCFYYAAKCDHKGMANSVKKIFQKAKYQVTASSITLVQVQINLAKLIVKNRIKG